MKIEIEQDRYEQLLATEKKVRDFITEIEDAAYEGYTDDDPDFLGNPDFDAEMIADIATRHFKFNF